MKINTYLAAGLFLVALTSAHTQPSNAPPGLLPQAGRDSIRFDIDFPGGHPKDLAAAIQKAIGRPLNALIPEEFADEKLPGIKVKNVGVAQLFVSLEMACRKRELMTNSAGQIQRVNSSCGFRSVDGNNSDDAVWVFYADRPQLLVGNQPKVCRFYSLAPYLERGSTVDDITTAVETGARMLGEPGPTMSFHKDTKLLIAVGEPGKLEIIDAVLRALVPVKPPPASEASASTTTRPKNP